MAPHDRFGAVWVIMMFLGMGTLFPWNVFIMLKYYFETRLRAHPTWPFFQTNFENIFVIVYQVSTCCTLAAMVLFVRIPMSLRILLPYVVIMLAMAIQTCLVFTMKLSGMSIACLAIATLIMMGIMCAVVQGGVYTKASILPLTYINAVIGGQGIAGFVVSLIQFITLATNSPQHPTNTQENTSWQTHYIQLVQKPSFYYFLASTIVMLLCVIGYLVLSYHPFVQYYRKKHETLIKRSRSDEEEFLVSEKEPLLLGGSNNDSSLMDGSSSSGEAVMNVESDAGGTLMHLEGQGKVYDIEGIGFSFCPAVHVVRVPPVEEKLNPFIRRSADCHNLQKQNSSSLNLLNKKSHSLDYRIFSDIFELLHRENQNENNVNNQNGESGKLTRSQDKLISYNQQYEKQQFLQQNGNSQMMDDEVYEETVVQLPGSFPENQLINNNYQNSYKEVGQQLPCGCPKDQQINANYQNGQNNQTRQRQKKQQQQQSQLMHGYDNKEVIDHLPSSFQKQQFQQQQQLQQNGNSKLNDDDSYEEAVEHIPSSFSKQKQQQQFQQQQQQYGDNKLFDDEEVYEETVVVQVPGSFHKQQYQNYNFNNLIYDVGIYALVVFLTFFIDMLVFPAVTQNIESTVKPSASLNFFDRLSQDLFMPCLFILFTGGEMVGRFACGYGPWAKKPPHSIILLLYALVRCIMASGLLFCNVLPINGKWRLPVLLQSNVWPALINGMMGLTTGHLGGTAMMHAPGLVPPSAREQCGSLITFAFGGGLMSGSLLSLAIVASLQTRI